MQARRRTRRGASLTRQWTRMRLALLAAGLTPAVALLAVGEHPSSTDRLRTDVAAGSVTSVQVLGHASGSDGATFTAGQVRWRAALLQRSATVAPRRRRHPRRRAPRRLLRARGGAAPPRQMSYLLHDIDVPLWVQLLALGSWLTALLALVRGPRPWRLTRWGWVWSFQLVPPVGIALFCLLAGPTPLVPGPRRARRLGGLAGLLLALLAHVLVLGRWHPDPVPRSRPARGGRSVTTATYRWGAMVEAARTRPERLLVLTGEVSVYADGDVLGVGRENHGGLDGSTVMEGFQTRSVQSVDR